ncbi:hypothetical protein [Actinomadura hibisca]|uniref:hypothetical protein n=1 Tax=Actinomadura hibisca TaxID=68565 RepID=UPI0008337590|nr:hypothetical protein [Actinomadura hibisca]
MSANNLILITADPHGRGYTAVCLGCFETCEAACGRYADLTGWTQEHTCHPDRAAAVSRLIGDRVARCLYCGSDDVFETRVTIDDRTEEMALRCGACEGTWAA